MSDVAILSSTGVRFETAVPLLIIGAGACGLTAALASHDAGVLPLLVERDPVPSGSTVLSSGMIPAAGTRWQLAANVVDSPQHMAADIQRKANHAVDNALLQTICSTAGPSLEWLTDQHAIELELVEGFLYPGHSQPRMHAPPSKTGQALSASLYSAVEQAGIDVFCNARVTHLYATESGQIDGIALQRPDGKCEQVGCTALILACNGYAGNPELVRRYIPEIAEAWYFGHPGNQGDALLWGQALGAASSCLGAYQGHGSVATPQGLLITWAIMMEGGVQVNNLGQRFANEHLGYSEQAVAVLTQPGGVAWNIYGQQQHKVGMAFEDYRQACALGAIKTAPTVLELARVLGLPAKALSASLEAVENYAGGLAQDPLGRIFNAKTSLRPPWYGVKVTGALFHTQGGLLVDQRARVLRSDRTALPNLWAAGGAACGLSGTTVAGYLSGNGLLSAVVLGRIAGQQAAAFLMQ